MAEWTFVPSTTANADETNMTDDKIRRIHLIDTSVASDNLGDEIIVEKARHHLMPVIGDAYISTSSGHDGLGPFGRRLAAEADLVLLLGTNALSARYRGRKFIWRVKAQDVTALQGKVVLVGVGANRDFKRVAWRQRWLINRLLSPTHRHSVRDDLAAKILSHCGREAINTSCPTLWEYRSSQPVVRTSPADDVCFTLTGNKPDTSDRQMIDILRQSYKRIAFWPQMPGDLGYLKSITGLEDIRILAPNLIAYDDFLSTTNADVIGTRLHGGIRGLSHGCRIGVVAIDNRARDIGSGVNLPTIPRAELATRLPDFIASPPKLHLNVNAEPIDRFLSQISL